MKSIRRIVSTFSTSWSSDPGARGAAKMTAGAGLLVEGLFGGVSMIVPGRRGSGGLIGACVLMCGGALFLTIGLLVKPNPDKNEVHTIGRIVEIEQTKNKKVQGGIVYSPIYAYTVDGREYRLPSQSTSSIRPRIGNTVDIAYSKSQPENARRADGLDGNFHWIIIGIGGLLLAVSLWGVVISLLMILLGTWLILRGRADRKSVQIHSGFFSDLVSLVNGARSGQVGEGQVPAAAMAAPENSSFPPAGWYPDPETPSGQRWWDGSEWTEQRRS